jgi:hypothetical protein
VININIGSKNSTFHGFSKMVFSLSERLIVIASMGTYHLSSPVSFRFFWALCLRIGLGKQERDGDQTGAGKGE